MSKDDSVDREYQLAKLQEIVQGWTHWWVLFLLALEGNKDFFAYTVRVYTAYKNFSIFLANTKKFFVNIAESAS